jgi:menaquinol-cytochrome c reductase iron-sulfur subunit
MARTAWPQGLQAPAHPTAEAAEVTRRTFLSYVTGGLAAFMGMVLGLPMIGYLSAPLARKESLSWLSLGKVDTFTPGTPKLVSVSIVKQDGWRRITEARACWVLRDANGEFSIFNGRCTHLGCLVSWLPDRQVFKSPCHEGVFSPDGTVLDGPPPRPLDRLEAHVDGDEVFVLYQDFRLGIPEKESV